MKPDRIPDRWLVSICHVCATNPNPAHPPNTSIEGSPTGPFVLLNELVVPEPVLRFGIESAI